MALLLAGAVALVLPGSVSAQGGESSPAPSPKTELLAQLSSEDPFAGIDQTVRERINEDSKRVGRIAENLVSVQGEITTVEKEVLGKVFDMASMKAFLDTHDSAVTDNKRLTEQLADLERQVSALTAQLAQAQNDTLRQETEHHTRMSQLEMKANEDDVIIQSLNERLPAVLALQKEVQMMPQVNSNLTGTINTGVTAAQVAQTNIMAERAKLSNYRETSQTLMRELVKQHTYAVKCHARLTELNSQIHGVMAKREQEQALATHAADQGHYKEKQLVQLGEELRKRLLKARQNLDTIHLQVGVAKHTFTTTESEGKARIAQLNTKQLQVNHQASSIEAGIQAKISNRVLIEKVINGERIEENDMQQKLLDSRMEKLRSNNTQLQKDLADLRQGILDSQANTAKMEAATSAARGLTKQLEVTADDETKQAQQQEQDAVAKVAEATKADDEAASKAHEAEVEAQSSQMKSCEEIWWERHPDVKSEMDHCEVVKNDLPEVEAQVAMLQQSLNMS